MPDEEKNLDDITIHSDFIPDVEYWRPCIGKKYFGFEVSSFGNVREAVKEIYYVINNKKELAEIIPSKPVSQYLQNNKYTVSLHGNIIGVHRLVAMNFLVNSMDKKCIVIHKDGNIKNNHITNLEYVSYSLYKQQINKDNIIFYTPIKCITTGQYFSSIKSVSSYFQIPYMDIQKRIQDINKVYEWNYDKDFIKVSKEEIFDILNSKNIMDEELWVYTTKTLLI